MNATEYRALQEKLDRISRGEPVMENEKVIAYQQADEGFKKLLNTINSLEKMVRENGFLEKKLVDAAGMDTARLQPLADMRQALSDAYDACEDAYQDAMGDFVATESKIAESQPLKEDNTANMPFMEVIYQYVDEEESSGDARLYLDGGRLVDDVRFMLEKDNPDVEIIALSESKK